MRLLLITQKMDRNDDVLGFMHGWTQRFSEHFEQVTVICLQKGEVVLPSQIRIFSLGKEEGVGRMAYVRRLFQIVWRERSTYDAVLVHMNAEYMMLAGWLWALLGKKRALWYNHWHGDWRVWVARAFAQVVFHTSAHAYTARFSNAKKMPVGVDTDLFAPEGSLPPANTIISVGRISPTKRLEVLIAALQILHNRGFSCHADIYGDRIARDEAYYQSIRAQAAALEAVGVITFHGPIANRESAPLYSSHAITVNMSPDGHFDKVIIEGMSCERLVLISNTMLTQVLPPMCMFTQDNAEDMAAKLQQLMQLSDEERVRIGKELRAHVLEQHSLRALIAQLKQALAAC